MKRCALAALMIAGGLEGLAAPPLTISSVSDRPLRVSIIAVTEFDDQTLTNPTLNNGVKEATAQLRRFFRTYLNVDPVVYATHAETTDRYLRGHFLPDLRNNTQRRIHLVLVLTHGFAQTYGAKPKYKRDLLLAASNTNQHDLDGTTISANEMLLAIRGVTSGSSVFVFLDTCGSGSIGSSGVREDLERYGAAVFAHDSCLRAVRPERLCRALHQSAR